MSWKNVKLADLLTESKVLSENPNPDKRITVRLKVLGVEKRGIEKEVEGATKQYVRRAGQFIYGKQNFHKGAFGIVPKELDGFESSSDLPSFDVDKSCLPEFIFYFFKQGNFYLELEKIASGVATQRINTYQFLDLEIPLPPITEQVKIIKKISEIENKNLKIATELNLQLDLVKKLKQQLLNDAVQGKLVPQNFDDEPASALLARIKTEKAQSGKKEKPLPPITKTEIPFEIPSNWVWCRLGEIGDLKRGKSKHRPRNDESLFENGIYPFIQTGDVSKAKFNQDLIITVNNYYNEFGLKQSEMQMKGTFCITIAANIAECGFLDFDACVPDSIVCFSALNKYFEKYAFYYLKIAKEELEKFAPATAQKNINLGILNDLRIPIPPLEEQKRIVEKLEHLMAQCNALETHITESAALNAQLLQQVLREALQSEK